MNYADLFKARILKELPNDLDGPAIAQDELERLESRTDDPVADAEACIKLWADDGSQAGPT